VASSSPVTLGASQTFEESMQELDWKNLSPEEFEHLCFDLVAAIGFVNVNWRRGGADRGRDLEAIWQHREPGDTTTSQRWFIECKRYLSAGVPVAELVDKVAWADAEKPDYLLVITNSHLTPATKDWLKAISNDKPYQIRVWEDAHFVSLLRRFPDLIRVYFKSPESRQRPIRTPRLVNDYQLVRDVVAKSGGSIEIERTVGHPPQRYVFKFNCRVVADVNDDDPVWSGSTRIGIALPEEYPMWPAIVEVLSPLFHPQVQGPSLCAGWSNPQQGLDHLITGLYEIVAFYNYSLRTPMSMIAAEWYRNHPEFIEVLRDANANAVAWIEDAGILSV
jgi:ubiquitin-protein ligase